MVVDADMTKDSRNQIPSAPKVTGIQILDNKNDGWMNVITGMGSRRHDKTVHTKFDTYETFTDQELAQMYMGDGLAKKIISRKPKDMVRNWLTLPGDEQGKIKAELDRLKVKTAFQEAMTWARLYRGAVIVLLDSQADLKRPLARNPKMINGLRVYPASRIEVMPTDIVGDANNKYFDDVEYFPIRFRNGTLVRVHASRCLVFKGETAPDEQSLEFKYRYWGIPTIMNIYKRLGNVGSIETGIVNMILEFNIGKYTLSNLAQLLSSNRQEDLDKIYNRMDIINVSKNMLKAVMLGDGEKYERDSASAGGLADLFDRVLLMLAAVSEYPATLLYGRSPAGENATGESDLTQYYDDVAAIRDVWMLPPLQKLVNIIAGYENVKDTTIVFNSLWQPSDKEMAEVMEIKSRAYLNYINGQVIGPDEVAEKEFPEITQASGEIV